MTWGAAIPTWVTSAAIGGPSRGDSAWAALWVSWRASWPWPGSPSTRFRWRATSGRVDRRQGRSAVLTGVGRPNRKRRQYLVRKDAAIRRRRRERGRLTWPE